MIKVRGIYDGETVRLLDDVYIPPDTEVEVLVPDASPSGEPPADPEQAFWDRLIQSGLISKRPRRELLDDSFEPIPNPGEPVSDTIIRERR